MTAHQSSTGSGHSGLEVALPYHLYSRLYDHMQLSARSVLTLYLRAFGSVLLQRYQHRVTELPTRQSTYNQVAVAESMLQCISIGFSHLLRSSVLC